MPTKTQPCNDDPEYNYHQCVESFFYSRRGCQYPWNAYKGIDLLKCTNYTGVMNMLKRINPSWGSGREGFTPFFRLKITQGKCPPPCFSTQYDVQFETWSMWGPNVSLQIAFSDFLTIHREEYLACDNTCILGQLGGNLGLFLGGSILLGLDILMEYIGLAATLMYRTWKKMSRQ